METNATSEAQLALIKIAELTLEVQRLREALAPFALSYDQMLSARDASVSIHDYQRAKQVLASSPQLILALSSGLSQVKTNPQIKQEAPDATPAPAPAPVPTPTPQLVPRPALPTISSDPTNSRCPFKIGDRVEMTYPFKNQFGIEVGDQGIVENGYGGMLGVIFDKNDAFLVEFDDVFVTDLCEKIADVDGDS